MDLIKAVFITPVKLMISQGPSPFFKGRLESDAMTVFVGGLHTSLGWTTSSSGIVGLYCCLFSSPEGLSTLAPSPWLPGRGTS